MNFKKKVIPVICLMSAYVHWIKPRLLCFSAPKDSKSLLLHLCARSRFLIPMIVFTAFWIFDAQMQIEASVSLSLTRNVRITLGPDGAQPGLNVEDNAEDGNDDDDDDSFSMDSYSSEFNNTSDSEGFMDYTDEFQREPNQQRFIFD